MSSFSQRLLAVVLAISLLPLAAWASDDGGSPAKSTTASDITKGATTAGSGTVPAVGLNPAPDPLLQLLVAKGILNSNEVNSLAAAPANQMRDQLLLLLKAKGVLSAEDVSSLNAPASTVNAAMVSSPNAGSAAA